MAGQNGLDTELKEGRIGVASQGTSALIYATGAAREAVEGLLAKIQQEPWAGTILTGAALAATGLIADGLVAAVDTTRHDESNPHGVAGTRWLVEDGEGTPEIGCGHHGGLGPAETRPFLTLIHPELGQGEAGRPTSLVDIAPTILRFLGEAVDDMDGVPLAI